METWIDNKLLARDKRRGASTLNKSLFIVQCWWSVHRAMLMVGVLGASCTANGTGAIREYSHTNTRFYKSYIIFYNVNSYVYFKKNGRYNGMDVLWYYYSNSLSSTNYEVMQWWYSSSLSYFLFWKLFYYIPTTVISISMCLFSHKLGQIHPNQLDKYDIDFIFKTEKTV